MTALVLTLALLFHPSFVPKSEQALVRLVNRAREADHLRPLAVDPALSVIARERSSDMALRGYFSHYIPGGGMVWDWMDQQHYCYDLAGENIGWDIYDGYAATTQIQSMFLASPEHRANELGRAWTSIGIGVYRDSHGRMTFTVLFADKQGCPQ